MIGPIINIILGGLMIAGGLSGQVVLIGTNASWPLVGIGAALVGLGLYRVIKRASSREE